MKTFLIILSLFSSAYGNRIELPLGDIHQIEKITKLKGVRDSLSGSYRLTAPHSNLKASAAGIQLTPQFGLSSWVEFIPLAEGSEIKGELILLQDQVNLILQMALEQTLTITFLHNLSLWDSPPLMIMGIEGKGRVQDLAMTLDKLFQTLKISSLGTIWKKLPAMIHPEKSTLTLQLLEELLARKAEKKEGVTRFDWEEGTWVSFAGSDRETAMYGNITIPKDSMNEVLQYFLKKNIYILSIRPHTFPQKVVIRFLGRGPILDLGNAFKEALESTSLKPDSLQSSY